MRPSSYGIPMAAAARFLATARVAPQPCCWWNRTLHNARYASAPEPVSSICVCSRAMGAASIEELHASIEDRDCLILNVGNPQCVFFVENFDFEWQALGARVERHPRFPHRTNVSFVRVLDRHTLDV